MFPEDESLPPNNPEMLFMAVLLIGCPAGFFSRAAGGSSLGCPLITRGCTRCTVGVLPTVASSCLQLKVSDPVWKLVLWEIGLFVTKLLPPLFDKLKYLLLMRVPHLLSYFSGCLTPLERTPLTLWGTAGTLLMDQLLFASSKARAILQAIGVDRLRTRGSREVVLFPTRT